MLKALLETHGEAFGLLDIVNEGELARCRRTAFTWTELPETLCLATDRSFLRQALENPNVAGVVVPPGLVRTRPTTEKLLIVCDDAPSLFYAIHNAALHGPDLPSSRTTVIAPTAEVHPTAVVEEGASIGERVVIGAACVVMSGCDIGAETVLEPGVIIGGDGLFSKPLNGHKVHVRHFGGVRVGGRCYLHAGVTVARSVNAGEVTVIEDEVHIGPQAVIGHDSVIGERSGISSKAVICGRARVGRDCWIGAAAVVSNSVVVGDGAKIRAGAVAVQEVPVEGDVSGNFAVPHVRHMKRFLEQSK